MLSAVRCQTPADTFASALLYRTESARYRYRYGQNMGHRKHGSTHDLSHHGACVETLQIHRILREPKHPSSPAHPSFSSSDGTSPVMIVYFIQSCEQFIISELQCHVMDHPLFFIQVFGGEGVSSASPGWMRKDPPDILIDFSICSFCVICYGLFVLFII